MSFEDVDLAALERELAGTVFAGRLNHFSQIDSTSTRALDEARKGAPHGSYFVADEQTAGRGRSDHAWHSAAGDGLYLSVVLRPPLAVSDLAWVSLIAGLCVHRAIHEVTALEPDLRWPNDILIAGRKVAGILVESPDQTQAQTQAQTLPDPQPDPQPRAVVVGIGVNLHQRSFPAGLATPATSLDLETGRHVSRRHLLVALLQSLQTEMEALENESGRAAVLARIPSRVEAISSWVRGRAVAVHGPQACSGMTDGLDARGLLRVITGNGPVTITTGGLRALNP